MTKDQYLNLMTEQYFSVCVGKTVLEIGPSDGYHTNIIGKISSRLTLIEPYSKQHNDLKKIPGVTNIIVDDANFVLEQPLLSDVVVCCGVLYHLHSPLHLLELIVNNCDPEYVILDSVNSSNEMQFFPEEDNIPGNRQLIPSWRSAGFKLTAPFNIINQSMNNMGYTLVKNHSLNVTDFFSKSNSWVALWEKIK